MAINNTNMCYLEIQGWEAIRSHLRELQEDEEQRNGGLKGVLCNDEAAFWGLFGGLLCLLLFVGYWATIGRFFKCGCGRKGTKKGRAGVRVPTTQKRRWPFHRNKKRMEGMRMRNLMELENASNEGQQMSQGHSMGTGTRPKTTSGYIGGMYTVKT